MTELPRESNSDDGDRLPGEIDRETQDAALKAAGLRMIRDSLEVTDDVYLVQLLAMYVEEFERRFPEEGKWKLVQE